jgi:hypothetical protein
MVQNKFGETDELGQMLHGASGDTISSRASGLAVGGYGAPSLDEFHWDEIDFKRSR